MTAAALFPGPGQYVVAALAAGAVAALLQMIRLDARARLWRARRVGILMGRVQRAKEDVYWLEWLRSPPRRILIDGFDDVIPGPGYVQTAPGVYWRDDVFAAGLARGAFPEQRRARPFLSVVPLEDEAC